MRRIHLLPVLAAVALGLAACSSPGDGTTPTEQPTAAGGTTASADQGDTESATADDDGPTPGDTSDDEAAGQTSPTPTVAATPSDGGVTTPDEDTPVTMAFDGRPVPLATTCAGVDGAILATTEGEVTITVVREHGVSLRYQAEGSTAETDEVTVDEAEDETVYSATLAGDQVEPLAVTLTVPTGARAGLPDCG